MQLGISMGETLYFQWGYDVLNPGMMVYVNCSLKDLCPSMSTSNFSLMSSGIMLNSSPFILVSYYRLFSALFLFKLLSRNSWFLWGMRVGPQKEINQNMANPLQFTWRPQGDFLRSCSGLWRMEIQEYLIAAIQKIEVLLR